MDVDLPPVADSNLMVDDKLDQGTHANEILKNLQQHLKEGQETLMNLAQKGNTVPMYWNPMLAYANNMEDAMDIMLSSDLRMGEEDDEHKNLLESDEDVSDEEREFELKKQQSTAVQTNGENTAPQTTPQKE